MADPTITEEEVKQARVRKLLSEPVMAEMPEELRRTKRNFLALTSLMIFYQWSGIVVTKLAFFGVNVSVKEPQWILWIFLIIGTYFAVQFVWLLSNYFAQVRIRVTGAKNPYTTSDGGGFWGGPDISPVDSRQSSLHFWWSNMLKGVPGIIEIEKSLGKLKESLDEIESSPDPTPQNLEPLRIVMNDLNTNLKEVRTELSSQKIQISLGHYDKWFRCFSVSQRWRFYLLDVTIPVLLGGLALYLTINAICTYDSLPLFPASLLDLFR